MPIHEAAYARNSSFSELLHSSKFFEATNTTPRVWVAALVIVAVLWRAPNLPSTSSRSEMFWFMQAWMEMLVVGAILALALPQDFRRDLGFGDFESPTPRGWVAAFVILIFVAFALPPAGSDSAVVEKKRVDQRHQYKTTKNRDTAFEAPADAKEPQDSPRATSTVVATGSSIVRGIINRSKALTYSPPYSSPSLRSPHSPLSTSSRVRQEYEWCVDRISESKRNPKTWKTWAMDFYDEQQRKKNKVAQQKDGNHDDHDDDSDSDEGNDNHAQTPALHRAVSLAPQKIVEYRVRGADGTSKIVSANDEPETSRTTEKLPAWADRSSMTDDEWEYYGASPPSEYAKRNGHETRAPTQPPAKGGEDC